MKLVDPAWRGFCLGWGREWRRGGGCVEVDEGLETYMVFGFPFRVFVPPQIVERVRWRWWVGGGGGWWWEVMVVRR